MADWTPRALFDPIRIANLDLPNRLVMAPMTREFAPGGVPGPAVAEYYARRARGGVALIVTEGVSVPHPVAHHSNRVPHLYGEAALAAWRGVVAAVHQAGGRIIPQLWHCGMGRIPAETDNPGDLSIAPSIVGQQPLRAMTDGDIADVIQAFVLAAENARAVGFDGIAIHGAHGYLIDSFLWARTNRRTDGYGGTGPERTRFAVDLIRAIRRQVGPSFPIMFRFSQWKGHHYDAKLAETPDELAAVLTPIADAGVDIFDASTRRFWLPEFVGSDLNLAGWAKKLTGRGAMTVGSIGLEEPLDARRVSDTSGAAVSHANVRALDAMIESGAIDLAALGRILLANPEWPQLVRSGVFDRIQSYDPARTSTYLEPALADAQALA